MHINHKGEKYVKISIFEFQRKGQGAVLLIKGRALNSNYSNLSFKTRDLLSRWAVEDSAGIKRAITTKIQGTSRTIVFVGDKTYNSQWVPHEVRTTLEAGKSVYAIRLNGTNGDIPKCLSDNDIKVHAWSEEKLQQLANV